MGDLRGRFAALDDLPVPYLWDEVERQASRTAPIQRSARPTATQAPDVALGRPGSLGLVGLLVLLALAVVATALVVGSIGRRQTTPLHLGPGVFLPTGPMTQARSSHAATLLADGRVLILGGQEGHGPYTAGEHRRPEVWDPATEAFTASQAPDLVPLLPHPLPDGRIVLARPDEDDASSLVAWDPSTGTSAVSQHRFTAEPLAMLLPDGRVLLLGALAKPHLGEGSLGQVWNPTDDTLVDLGLFSPTWVGGRYTVAPLSDGTFLVLGGFETSSDPTRSGPPSEWEVVLDPMARTTRRVGPMLTPRLLATATALSDGRVLVAGGVGPDARPMSAEVWDPSTDTFRSTGPMLQVRIRHTSTLLADGRVLVAGGAIIAGEDTQVTASAELFDPVTDTFSPAASMATAREEHTATLLDDGRVLVVGGEPDVRSAFASAELFDPLGTPAP